MILESRKIVNNIKLQGNTITFVCCIPLQFCLLFRHIQSPNEPKKKLPIEDFLRAQGRFKHLFKPGNEHLIEEFQKEVDRRWENLLYKCDR